MPSALLLALLLAQSPTPQPPGGATDVASVGASSPSRPEFLQPVLAPGSWELRLGAGPSVRLAGPTDAVTGPVGLAGVFNLAVGLTPRIQLYVPSPAVSILLNEPGRSDEWVATLGAPTWGFALGNVESGVYLNLHAGVDGRQWQDETVAFQAGVSFNQGVWMGVSNRFNGPLAGPLVGRFKAGLVVRAGERWTFNPGIATSQWVDTTVRDARWGGSLSLGSTLAMGARPQPLVQFQLWDDLSLDGYGEFTWGYSASTLSTSAVAGFTWKMY